MASDKVKREFLSLKETLEAESRKAGLPSLGAQRYYYKKAAGISEVRRDGSKSSPEVHEEAAGAEKFAANHFKREFNSDLYLDHGDGGHDFTLNTLFGEKTVEVIWLGFNAYGRPRTYGNIIRSPKEPHRFADIYLAVTGSMHQRGFRLHGWCSHKDLEKHVAKVGMRDFGYGECLWIDAQHRKIPELEDIIIPGIIPGKES